MARPITVARLFYQLEANTKGLDRDLQGAEKSFGRTAAFIKANPAVAVAALGTAMVGVAVKAVEMAKGFEKSMAEVGTLIDATSEDMSRLADGVLGLYRNLPVENIKDLTQGLYNVISAGIPAGEAIEFLDIAARAAVGGVTDVNTAVNGLAAATNAFKLQGLTATEAADKFFVAVKDGVTTFEQISGSIGNVAGLANSLGVSLDDLLAGMVTLTKGGLDTSVAFNSLRQILANVAKPTAELKREYPELAKEFDLTALRAKGLTQFMADLAPHIQENNDVAVTMFGSVEALNAVLSLTADGGETLIGVTEEMANSAGKSAEAFEEMSQSNEALSQILKNQFSASLIELGVKLLPAVNAGLKVMIGLIDAVTGGSHRAAASAAGESIKGIAEGLAGLEGEKRSAEIERLGKAMQTLVLPESRNLTSFEAFSTVARQLGTDIGTLASRDLQQLYQGLSAAANSGSLTAERMELVRSSIRAIGAELTRRKDAIIPEGAFAPAQIAARDLARTLTEVRDANVELGKKSIASLEQYQQALLTVLSTEKEAAGDRELLIAIEEALIKKRQEGSGAGEEAARKAKEAADRYADAHRRLAEIVAETTVTMVDDTELAIARMRESFKGTGLEAENLARALRPLEDRLRLIKAIEPLGLPDILKKSAQAWTPQDIDRLRQGEAALRGMLADTTQLLPGTQAWKEATEQHAEVSKALFSTTTATKEQVQAAIRPSEEWVRRAREAGLELDNNLQIVGKTVESSRGLSDKVKDIALGAIGVAEGFGIIDSTAASALKSIVGIADALPQAFSGDPNAIFSVLGGLTGVIGALFGGNSAEERARKELIRKNTEAIRELERTNGNLLRVNSPGFQLSGAREVLGRFLPALQAELSKGGVSAQQALGGLQQNLATRLLQSGLSLGNLENLAKDLGINIRTSSGNLSVAGLTQLLEALETGQFTKFADEIQEQFERIKTGIELGVIAPADELKEILKVLERPELGKGVPAIARAFSGIDIGTAEGREQARGNLQNLFRDLELGTLSEADFGGLSGSEFRDILVRLFDFLGDADAAAKKAAEEAAEAERKAAEAAERAAIEGDIENVEKVIARAREELEKTLDGFAKAIAKAEAELADPDLTEDQRRVAENRLASLRTQLETFEAGGQVIAENRIAALEAELKELQERLREVGSAPVAPLDTRPTGGTSTPVPLSPPVVSGPSQEVDDSDTLGNRLPATLDDLLGVNEEANRFLEQILAEITQATSGGPLRPPALPRGFLTQSAPARAGGGSVSITGLSITVNVAGTAASAEDIGAASATALEEMLDRLLSERLQRERAILGDGRLP